MPRENEELNRPPSTIIGKGFTIQAAGLSGADALRVDGTVVGEIKLDGALFLSETGIIEGPVHVSSARIAGQVTGNIICRSMLHLASTAVVIGDVTTSLVVVDEGAKLQGMCKTRNADTETNKNVL